MIQMNAILKRLRSPIIVQRAIVLSNQENYEIKKIPKEKRRNKHCPQMNKIKIVLE